MAVWIDHWLARHRHAVNRRLHAVAIPLLPLAAALVVWQWLDGAWLFWWRPVALIVTSYALQWIGHKTEGNDMGEMILIKRLLGRPYVAIAPRYRPGSPPDPCAQICR